MILYFTGTGNSKFVAQRLGNKLNDEVVDLFTYIREGYSGDFTSEKPFVFVTPTYAWRIPLVVEEVIKRSTFNGNKACYFVMTCGDSIANAGKYQKILCESAGLDYKGVFKIVMPENYIAMFNAPDAEKSKEIIKSSLLDIDIAAKRIESEKPYESKTTAAESLMSSIVNKTFTSFIVKDKAFRIVGDCIGCGLCAKLCPMKNIVVKNNRPTWNGNCIHCMACICHCPAEVIEYGKKSVGQPRYKCPEMEDTAV